MKSSTVHCSSLSLTAPPFAVPIAIELVLVRDEPIAYAPAETDGELVADPTGRIEINHQRDGVAGESLCVTRRARFDASLGRRLRDDERRRQTVSVESSDTSFR